MIADPNDAQDKMRPLAGVRVIDFTMFVAGPCCTRSLADLGADVIKVEPPSGDYVRSRAPLRNGSSSYFGHLNAGKRSLVLDLKKWDALKIAKDLIATADIVVENGRPGNMRRLGLDYDAVAVGNPKLIYCSISGFGQSGPGASRPAYAQTVQAASGYDLAMLAYQDNQDRPANTGVFPADILAGVYAFSAIMTALFQRERSGRGQFIDVSLMDGMMHLLPREFQEAQQPQVEPVPTYRPMRTLDSFVMIALVSPKNFFELYDAVGQPELKSDPRFSTTAARMENWALLSDIIESWTSARPAAECVALLTHAGIPVAEYKTVKDAAQDPQFAYRESFATVEDRAGAFLVPNLPFKLSDSATSARPFVAALGEHNSEIIEELGR